MILNDFNEIWSDLSDFLRFVENAEKRVNSYFSKFVDFNLIFIMIIPEIYAIVDWIFRFSFQFNFHRATPRPRCFSTKLYLRAENTSAGRLRLGQRRHYDVNR